MLAKEQYTKLYTYCRVCALMHFKRSKQIGVNLCNEHLYVHLLKFVKFIYL
jgi:hypothetical protein